ncbi:hypothetical protein HA466_0311260 [Hirschfeldia incana]|nr:hypothetical protein HA466_0311260 [Hirschfeldia incana]KAJ0230031.1 hypothetical protein HA466_0311260 [Hirschfeldia incana]
MAFHNASQMVRRTFTFQLKLTEFNFSASISLSRAHAYLISTITPPFPNFVNQVTTTQAMTSQELVLTQFLQLLLSRC